MDILPDRRLRDGHAKGQSVNQREMEKAFGDLCTPFECVYCTDRNIFVMGPHSHFCKCGERAYRGWYTIPQCERCYGANK